MQRLVACVLLGCHVLCARYEARKASLQVHVCVSTTTIAARYQTGCHHWKEKQAEENQSQKERRNPRLFVPSLLPCFVPFRREGTNRHLGSAVCVSLATLRRKICERRVVKASGTAAYGVQYNDAAGTHTTRPVLSSTCMIIFSSTSDRTTRCADATR